MKKIYCDICKKQIISADDNWNKPIELKVEFGINKYQDICNICSDDIGKYILALESKKKEEKSESIL